MYIKIFLSILLALAFTSCGSSSHKTETHDEHKEVKFQYTSYSSDFELFVEADPLIVGKKANILSHFSVLPDFKAIEKSEITIILSINGKETKQSLSATTRKGIYSFDIQPEIKGTGKLTFKIDNEKGTHVLIIPEVTVFANEEEAHHTSEKEMVSKANTTVFTKEQSWKIEFATAFPSLEPLGQVIKTTALVQSAQSHELIITAKTNGVVLFNSGELSEGLDVTIGQPLFTISGSHLADNNISIKYSEAKSNYEKANADYERAKELAKDKIVSDKDFLTVKNQYQNAKAVYDNYNKNFNTSGQTITSQQSGFIKQIFVNNGAYVEQGEPIAIVSQNKWLLLNAEVPSKYASVLAKIKTANIRTLNENRSFSLESLHGKILSYGKATNSNNFLISITLQIENNGCFVPGNFVEIYLKSLPNDQVLVIPTTSLMEEQGSYFVWIQVTPELFEKREVFIGKTDGVNTEIERGIIAEERIVTHGAMYIKLAQATGSLDAHSGHVH